MLKQKYFLADIFILSAEKQPIKLSWRKIEWLPIDMVPDFIVGGFLDDVTVIGWAITKVAQELEDYKLYRPSNFDYLE